MQFRLAATTLLGTMALALGACSSVTNHARFTPRVIGVEQQAEGLSQTNQGRVHLYANRTGLAIEAFRNALANGEAPAPAYNGLGVAYARLGRPDLAESYFSRAVASDPANLHFAENFAKLMRSPAYLAMASVRTASPNSALADSALANSQSAGSVQSANAATTAKPAPMERISRGEVRIVTNAASAANRAPAARLATTATPPRQSAIARVSRGEVRITAAAAAPAPSPYPVRVQFSSARKPAPATARAPEPTRSRTISFGPLVLGSLSFETGARPSLPSTKGTTR